MRGEIMENPRVSVVIPAYNHERYVGEAIQSVLNQTFQDFELIIINDGSTDRTEEEILKFHDPRIRYYSQENRGLSATLNRGIELARGEFFTFLPSDDMMLPEKLQIQTKVLEESKDLGLVFSYPIIIDAQGKEIIDDPIVDWFKTPFDKKEEIFPALFERNFLCAPTVLIRKECFKKVGFFDESLKTAQDYDMWMRILKYYDLKIIKLPLLKLRWHGGNLTYRPTEETEMERAKVILNAFKNLKIEEISPGLLISGDKENYAEAYERVAKYVEKSNLLYLIPVSKIYMDMAKRYRGEMKDKGNKYFSELSVFKGKINILIETLTLDRGGMENVIYNFVKYINKDIFRVVIGIIERGGEVERKCKEMGIAIEKLRENKEECYREVLERYCIDVVISHHSTFGARLSFEKGIPYIYVIHSIYSWYSEDILSDFRRTDKYISKYIAVSEYVKNFSIMRFNISEEKIRVIKNGIDFDEFSKLPCGKYVDRNTLGLKEDDYLFLNVAAINPLKGQNVIISALKDIKDKYPNIKVLCVGDVLDKTYLIFLKEKIKRYGLENNFIILGYSEDIRPYYKLSDAFLLTSFIEGLPISVIEAIVYRLPVIITDTGGVKELIENINSAVLLRNCFCDYMEFDIHKIKEYSRLEELPNKGELVDAMLDFYNRREFWKQKASMVKISEDFSIKTMMNLYEREILDNFISLMRRKDFILNKIIYEKETLEKEKLHLINRISDIESINKNLTEKFTDIYNRMDYIILRLSISERLKGIFYRIMKKIHKKVPIFLRERFREPYRRLFFNKITPVDKKQKEISNNKNQGRPHGLKFSPNFIKNKNDIFIFSIIDFSFRYQRPQQLATHLAKRGHRVFYLNVSQFLPLNTGEDFKIKEVKKNIFEVFLKSQCSFDVYGGELKNEILNNLYISLNSLRRNLQLTTVVSLIHNPFWAPLAFKMREKHNWKIFYDCIDEWNTFNLIGDFFLQQEERLFKEADAVTVTGELLYNKCKNLNKTTSIVRNACDYDYFIKSPKKSLLSKIKKPIIGYFGAIADWFDIEAISYAASQQKNWSFVLIGNVFIDVKPLKNQPNVFILGIKPYELIPSYLNDFDACLIPFKKNRVTEAVDPVKMYEYFSLGKPVVARKLYELMRYSDYLYLYDSNEEFVEKIHKALEEKSNEIKEERRKIAANNTWDERVEILEKKIKEAYKKASIIIVTFNSIDINRQCIESILAKTDYPNYEIIIVDNHSIDGTREYLENLSKKGNFIKVIFNQKNEGFPKATNQGIKISGGEYIILLNNDTIVTKGWLTKFINYLDKDPEIGLIGPVTNFCGNEAKINVTYKNIDELDEFAYIYTSLHENYFFEINTLGFFCVAMRKEIIDKVGLLDENFELGLFEDDDYCRRVRLNGYKVICAEDIFIHHFGQMAFKELIKTGEYREIFNRNKKRFEEKWGIKWVAHKIRNNLD